MTYDLIIDAGELAARGLVMDLSTFRWDCLGKVEELLRLLGAILQLLRPHGRLRLRVEGDPREFLVAFVTAFPVNLITERQSQPNRLGAAITSMHLEQVLHREVYEERSHERYARPLFVALGRGGPRVLDVGGGDGHMAEWWSQHGCEVHLLEDRVAFHDGVSPWPYEDSSFDTCLLLFVLHHIADSVETTLSEAARVAKRVLVLEDQPRSAKSKGLLNLAVQVTAQHFRPFGQDPQVYMRNIRPDAAWRQLFAGAGLQCVQQVEITGTLQHPVPHTLYELHPVPKDIGADFIPLEVCTRCDWVVTGQCLPPRLAARAFYALGWQPEKAMKAKGNAFADLTATPTPQRRVSGESGLRRFTVPQKSTYARPRRTQMWFMIPTPPYLVDGIERGSARNRRFALRTDEEVREYLRFEADGVSLRQNYLGLMKAILDQLKKGRQVTQLMGVVDEPKLRSSVRLFERAARDTDPELHLVLIELMTLASLYSERRGRFVWDALALPILALSVSRPRVLILGLGGGTCARIIQDLSPEAVIVGVELDAEVLRVARENFDLDALEIEVCEMDALQFLREDKRKFDLIIDDVFAGYARSVKKPRWLPQPGFRLARRRLQPGGLLVTNALCREAKYLQQGLQRLFPALLRLRVSDYENEIFLAGPTKCLSSFQERAEVQSLQDITVERPGARSKMFLKETMQASHNALLNVAAIKDSEASQSASLAEETILKDSPLREAQGPRLMDSLSHYLHPSTTIFRLGTTTAGPNISQLRHHKRESGSCIDDCSGHGSCSMGVCRCEDGYTGEACDVVHCKDDCSGRGSCLDGRCACDSAFYGAACEFPRCKDDCNGHGYCDSGKCVCTGGYRGLSCAERAPMPKIILPVVDTKKVKSIAPPSCPEDCNHKGRCEVDGTCSCMANYTGLACENHCPSGCSGKGACTGGQCICFFGWGGVDCSLPMCCNGHGDCPIPGTCKCHEGWMGEQCEIELKCPDPACSEHGTCFLGTCRCQQGWAGVACQQIPPALIPAAPGTLGDPMPAALLDLHSKEETGSPPAPKCNAPNGRWSDDLQVCVCEAPFHGEECQEKHCRGAEMGGR
eukprot:g2993.t2